MSNYDKFSIIMVWVEFLWVLTGGAMVAPSVFP